MKTEIFKDYAAFLDRPDWEVNGQTQEFADRGLPANENCKGCWNCSRCFDCSDCSSCFDCSSRSSCSDKAGDKKTFEIPKIENIHQKLLQAVTDGKLDMSGWHICETTHCRAGWITVLAGKEGQALEKETSTLFAAMQIYHASSPIKVSPARFFEPNEVAMKDIVRCAELEKSAAK